MNELDLFSHDNELSDFLASALQFQAEDRFPKGGGILLVDKLRDFFTTRLNCALLGKNIVESEMFLCANYIGDFLAGFSGGLPSATITSANGRKRSVLIRPAEYFFAYWQRLQAEGRGECFPDDKAESLLRGGQICFVISVFFPLFQRRRVGEDYYLELGAALFYHYWQNTEMKVAYYMAERFDELVPLTRDAIED